MHCNIGGEKAQLNNLILSVGEEFVDLLDSKTITASNKRKLTGKTVVAVPPLFKDHLATPDETTDMKNEDTKPTEDLDPEVEDKNIDDPTASKDIDDPSKETEDKEDKEDVIVPVEDVDTEDKSDHTSGLSAAALSASLEAITASLATATTEKEALLGKVSRLEAKIAEKDSEIERQKTIATDSLSETKQAYAQQLLSNRMVLKKSDVTSIDSKEAYVEKLKEYADRSLDSLKDALSDLGPEIVESSKVLGVKSAQDFMNEDTLENPVANVTLETEDSELPDLPKSDLETLTNYIN